MLKLGGNRVRKVLKQSLILYSFHSVFQQKTRMLCYVMFYCLKFGLHMKYKYPYFTLSISRAG